MNRSVSWRAVVVISFCTMVTHSSKADINDALDGMFMVTGTEPAVYESQRRGGVSFGTLRVRAPVTSFNVLNFTAPEVRAGCGGIDLYGGSFTFINTEQFRQVLRQIGANALGYAFKLALATMCDRCNQILTGLQNTMDEWNRAMKDSCRWAQGLVNDSLKATGLSESVKGMTTATNEGVFDDAVEATTEWFADVTTALGGGDATGANPDRPEVGNITWNALAASGVGGLFDYPGGGLSHNEILMNIAGTRVLRAPDAAELAAGRRENFNKVWGPRLTFAEIKSGKTQAATDGNDVARLLRCDEAIYCLKPIEEPIWDFQGVDAWVAARLEAIAEHMRNPATAGTPHSAAEQEFLGSVPVDVMRHLIELQGSDGLGRYVEAASPYLASVYAVVLGETMVRAIEAAYETEEVPEIPKHVRTAVDVFAADVKEERRLVMEEFGQTILDIEEMVDKIQRAERANRPSSFIDTASSN